VLFHEKGKDIMKKKGYVLAELLLYISIAMVIVVLAFNVLILSLKELKQGKRDEIAYDNMINLITYIDNAIREPISKSFAITDTKLTISLNNTDHEDEILNFTSGELKFLRIGYIGSGASKTAVLKESKILLSGVSNARFYKKNNLMYIYIKVGEEEIKKCLPLRS
jgi:hypothetical protein